MPSESAEGCLVMWPSCDSDLASPTPGGYFFQFYHLLVEFTICSYCLVFVCILHYLLKLVAIVCS